MITLQDIWLNKEVCQLLLNMQQTTVCIPAYIIQTFSIFIGFQNVGTWA